MIDGKMAVIKIPPPLANHEARSEAKYLRTLAGDGAIRLLDEDRVLDAMLLEHASPGKTLKETFEGNEPACIVPAILVLKQILRPLPEDRTDILSLDMWFHGLRRHRSTRFPVEYARTALDLYDNVLTFQHKYYLHGDFHPTNILSARRSPFVAIDPKGLEGPVGYEIAVFLNNYHWWLGPRADVKCRLDDAVKMFAEAFDLEPLTLRQWAFAQMVLGAWWTFDEMPELYSNEVAQANIWDI